MKKLILLGVVLFCIQASAFSLLDNISLNSNNNSALEGPYSFGIRGGLTVKPTLIADSYAITYGWNAMAMINKFFLVGISQNTMIPSAFKTNFTMTQTTNTTNIIAITNAFITNVSTNYVNGTTNSNTTTNYVTMEYTGFILGLDFGPTQPLHWSIQSLFGIGKAMEKDIFVIEPELHLEVNITDFIFLNFGAGYRFVLGFQETAELNNWNLSGLTLFLGINLAFF